MPPSSLNTPDLEQSRSASRQQSRAASPEHSCSDFDRVIDDASGIQVERGVSWVDALCLAAGRGMAVVCDEEGAVDVVAAAESGEAWL